MRLGLANAAFEACSTVRLMEDPVWHRLDEELAARRERHIAPGSWADVARALDTTEQRVNNWKRRGVPSAQYVTIAAVMGWTVDRLIGVSGDERARVPAAATSGKGQSALDEAQQVAAIFADL